MPTIIDIAKAAGVSHGTVSNVLNGRGNVSVEKIRLVEKAALDLGYKINTKAQILRQGKNPAIAVIVPSIRFSHYADIYEVLQQELGTNHYSVQLYTTNSMESSEQAAISDALSSRVSGIVAASCFPDAHATYRELSCDVPVIFIDGPSASQSQRGKAGFDYHTAGEEISQCLLSKNAKKIAVFSGSQTACHMDAFRKGLLPPLQKQGISVKWVSSFDYLAAVQAFDLFEPDDTFDFIVCTDMLRQQAAIAAHSFSCLHPLPAFITIDSRTALSNSNTLIYELDYRKLSYKIAKGLLQIIEYEETEIPPITVENSGFKYIVPQKEHGGEELHFLTVSSPASVALSRLLPHFHKKTGIQVHLTVLGLNEIYDTIQEECSSDSDTPYDLIRMDMAWISELASKLYAPLSSIPYDWSRIFGRILPELIQDYTTADDVCCCLPYDPSTQILFYRKDLFEDPTIKRMYYEYCKEELTVPESFEQYNKIAKFFTRTYNPNSPVKFGNTVAIGNSVVNPSEYLPRLFAKGGSLFDEKGKIQLQTPSALHALLNYKESYEYSDKSIHQWWKNALEGFTEGASAMTMVFMNHASDIINTRISNIAGKIGFAMVPGAKPLVGGGVIGIHPQSRNKEIACKFIDWLYSDEVSSVFTMLGGLSPCRTVYSNQNVLGLYPWLSAAKHSFSIGQRRVDNHYYLNFSEKKLEQLLSIEVKNAVTGVLPAEEALSMAQSRCEDFFIVK